jgi:hypothetical protein
MPQHRPGMARPEQSAKKRGRLRKRIILRFTKPLLQPQGDDNLRSSSYAAFKLFVEENRIPKRTGTPGGLVKLKFTMRKTEFVSMVEILGQLARC